MTDPMMRRHRLTAKAIHLALDQRISDRDAVRLLLASAPQGAGSLRQALANISRALVERPSAVGRRAEAIVRAALEVAEQRTPTVRADQRPA